MIAPTHIARHQIGRYVREWQTQRQVTNGDDLRAMGIPAGPIYGYILRRLRDAWLDGEVESIEAEKALLEQMLADGWDGNHAD